MKKRKYWISTTTPSLPNEEKFGATNAPSISPNYYGNKNENEKKFGASIASSIAPNYYRNKNENEN